MRTSTRAWATAATIGLGLVATGCGSDHGTSVARPSDRTVEVTMTDNAFQPTSIEVAEGETITFSFTNTGTARHEAVLGDDAVQAAHHDEMAGSTGSSGSPEAAGGDDHGDGGHGSSAGSGAITLEPGASGDLVHTFDEAGTVLIGCHEPGHWEAGMKATIQVS